MDYYTVYKITNLTNNMIYIGSHKTNNLDDGYYGSGRKISAEIKMIGKHNFAKEILSFHDSVDEMLIEEKRLVNREFIERSDTYNLIPGGGYNSHGTVLVTNGLGKNFRVDRNDPDYISGKIFDPNRGKVMVADSVGNNYRLYRNDPRILSGELSPITKGKTLIIDIHGTKKWVDVKDPKFISGEYIHITKNRKVSDETKMRQKETIKNLKLNKGSKNSMYGRCFISNELTKETKTIKKLEVDEWITAGWKLGRYKTGGQIGWKWMNNDLLKISRMVSPCLFNEHILSGWKFGRNTGYEKKTAK